MDRCITLRTPRICRGQIHLSVRLMAGLNMAFFEVTFNETIDLHTNYVSSSVYQKGNKLGTYTNLKAEEKFEPSRFH